MIRKSLSEPLLPLSIASWLELLALAIPEAISMVEPSHTTSAKMAMGKTATSSKQEVPVVAPYTNMVSAPSYKDGDTKTEAAIAKP